ncbi:MAG: ATP-binding protein, partial [Bacteroidetes bacterium]|nr:ATP-binding protein [Bacteroidota bacterium]
MSIYSKKQQWKLWLFMAAIVIIGASLWYTNTLVSKIAQEERKKVKLWADAIKKKAYLVKY